MQKTNTTTTTTTKEKQDYILLIMNCQKYTWKAELQKNSWLPNVNIKYYHVLGNETLTTDYQFDEENNILWVKTKDDYNSLPQKVITAYHAVHKTFDFKYLFKTDDDQVMTQNPATFFDVVANLAQSKEAHYGGHIVHVEIPYTSQYYKLHPELPKNIVVQKTKYCSGRFYFLSSQAISNLITKREEISKEYFEDYAIGYYLDDKWKETILKLNTNSYFQDIPNNVV